MKLWGKIWKHGRLVRDTIAEETGTETRTRKIFHLLEEICQEFDLGVPLWLDSNIRDFQRLGKTRFRQDSFIEEIPFDYLEIQILEE